jgi:hypothetical protein
MAHAQPNKSLAWPYRQCSAEKASTHRCVHSGVWPLAAAVVVVEVAGAVEAEAKALVVGWEAVAALDWLTCC